MTGRRDLLQAGAWAARTTSGFAALDIQRRAVGPSDVQ